MILARVDHEMLKRVLEDLEDYRSQPGITMCPSCTSFTGAHNDDCDLPKLKALIDSAQVLTDGEWHIRLEGNSHPAPEGT